MSTRANIVFKDERNQIQIYKHYDGYPEGILPTIKNALEYACKLPRWAADDFSAAYVAGNKRKDGGDVYIDGTHERGKTEHGDIEYLYTVEWDTEREAIRISWVGRHDEVVWLYPDGKWSAYFKTVSTKLQTFDSWKELITAIE